MKRDTKTITKLRASIIGEIAFRSAQRSEVVCGMRKQKQMLIESLKINVYKQKTENQNQPQYSWKFSFKSNS